MSTIITTLAIGRNYEIGARRLIKSLDFFESESRIVAWINQYPPGAPGRVIQDGYDYGPYCAKPFALREALIRGASIGILIDASFVAVRSLAPLIEHIRDVGYYFCRNGWKLGEWASDAALQKAGMSRERAMEVDEVSSYCVGLNFEKPRMRELLLDWTSQARDNVTFPGHHFSAAGVARTGLARNVGIVSTDPKVLGHRHDQTGLSLLADYYSLRCLVARPRFTAYAGAATAETVLVAKGIPSWVA